MIYWSLKLSLSKFQIAGKSIGKFQPLSGLGNPLLKELGSGDFIAENHLNFLAAKFVEV